MEINIRKTQINYLSKLSNANINLKYEFVKKIFFLLI